MGSTTKQVTSSSNNSPWAPAVPYKQDILGEAEGLYNSKAGASYFPGSTYAGLGGNTNQALSQIGNQAGSQQGIVTANAANRQAQGLLSNGGYNADMTQAGKNYNDIYNNNDANFEGALQNGLDQTRDMTTRALAGSGNFGGLSSDAIGVLSRNLGNQAVNARSAQFNQSQQNKMGATQGLAGLGAQGVSNVQGLTGLLPTINDARYGDYNQALGVGQAQDADRQAQIQAQIDRFNFNQSAPWEQLGNYSNIVNGAVGNYGTTKSTAPVQQPGLLQQIAGGALGLGGLLK